MHTQQCLVPGRHRKLKMQWPNKCHPADSRSVQFCLGFFVCFFNPQHSPLARNPLTVHPCHYQKQQIINNRPLNLYCSKQYLIEVWTGCDGHKSMVWFLTFPQPKHQLPYQHISDLKKNKNKRSHKCASRLIFFFTFN